MAFYQKTPRDKGNFIDWRTDNTFTGLAFPAFGVTSPLTIPC